MIIFGLLNIKKHEERKYERSDDYPHGNRM